MAVQFSERALCELAEGQEQLGKIGLTKMYSLLDINGGPIETVMIGRRRLLKVPSVLRLANEGYDPKPISPPRPTRKAA